jgi:hypothetical protein
MSIVKKPASNSSAMSSLTGSDKSVQAELQPDDPSRSLIYLSLQESLRHPSCVSNTWIDTIADFKNNPRTLQTPPYNDGALYYVDKKQKPLCMAFPAVLTLNGKYGKIGPYFNLMGDQGVKASFIFL